MRSCLGIDIIRNVCAPDLGDGFGPGKGGSLARREERRLAPEGHGIQSLLGLSLSARVLRVHVHAVCAAVGPVLVVCTSAARRVSPSGARLEKEDVMEILL